jgi:hypothetical protein
MPRVYPDRVPESHHLRSSACRRNQLHAGLEQYWPLLPCPRPAVPPSLAGATSVAIPSHRSRCRHRHHQRQPLPGITTVAATVNVGGAISVSNATVGQYMQGSDQRQPGDYAHGCDHGYGDQRFQRSDALEEQHDGGQPLGDLPGCNYVLRRHGLRAGAISGGRAAGLVHSSRPSPAPATPTARAR